MSSAHESSTAEPYRGSAEFLRMLDESGYREITFTGTGHYVALHRLMFHWTLLLGEVDELHTYATRWCYTADSGLALAALAEWQSRGFQGEPIGWHRHPDTGRRRPDGDPTREYIAG